MLDGVPISNNANLQSLGARGELSFASAAGGGIDLRRIPAATLERVEVIRGVPSARFGDLTQGVVLVDTRAGVVPPEARLRFDARTVEGTVLGGARLFPGQTGTASVNLARTRLAPGTRDDVGSRISGQLAHRFASDRLTLDTRIDAFQVLQDEPATPVFPDVAARSRDNGLRVSERARYRLGRSSGLEWTAAFEGDRQRSFTQAPRLRGAMPFTNRLTEGTQDGKFIGGVYVARVDVDGDPRADLLAAGADGTGPVRRDGPPDPDRPRAPPGVERRARGPVRRGVSAARSSSTACRATTGPAGSTDPAAGDQPSISTTRRKSPESLAFAQCSTRTWRPSRVLSQFATSPAAQMPGTLVRRAASATTPLSMATPAVSASSVLGRMPTPTTTVWGSNGLAGVGGHPGDVVSAGESTDPGAEMGARPRVHDWRSANQVPIRSPITASSGAVVGSMIVTVQPCCRAAAATSRPIQPAPTTTTSPPLRSLSRSASESSIVRR